VKENTMTISRLWKILFFVSCILLASCGRKLAASASTQNPAPFPSELTVAEYPLKQQPEAESLLLYYVDSVQGDPRLIHADERANTFDWSAWTCPPENQIPMGRCATLGTDKLVAYEEYNNLGQGHVTVTRNGEKIYKISVGHGSPINGLRGLWVYDNHWAVETANVTERQEGNTIYSDAVGQVTVDGVLLNDQLGYEEAFGFQTIHGKPFYFFRRDGKINASYNGVEIQLGYDEIPHYGCCSAATLNPFMFQNMVTFFARKGETWYYAEIGVFGQP
jgi:hypothetical protein